MKHWLPTKTIFVSYFLISVLKGFEVGIRTVKFSFHTSWYQHCYNDADRLYHHSLWLHEGFAPLLMHFVDKNAEFADTVVWICGLISIGHVLNRHNNGLRYNWLTLRHKYDSRLWLNDCMIKSLVHCMTAFKFCFRVYDISEEQALYCASRGQQRGVTDHLILMFIHPAKTID